MQTLYRSHMGQYSERMFFFNSNNFFLVQFLDNNCNRLSKCYLVDIGNNAWIIHHTHSIGERGQQVKKCLLKGKKTMNPHVCNFHCIILFFFQFHFLSNDDGINRLHHIRSYIYTHLCLCL